jgi:hypothetical protein
MRFLHVLFAVGFTLGSIRAWLVMALIQGRSCRVLIIVMPIHLLLGRPAILVVFAAFYRALPWSGVSFLVFGQVTRAFEFLVTAWQNAYGEPWIVRWPRPPLLLRSRIA